MELEHILKALGEPMRLKIYQCLLERKHCVRSLSRKLGISESAVSQHLKVMREADLVYGQKYGYHTHYMPVQNTIDCLSEAFVNMQKQSAALDRNISACQCKFRTEGK